jgi:4-hydroxythreonine-4-phosphate dehydrogenase
MSEHADGLVRVGITHGDFNGIGYEVIMKTFADHGMLELCTPVVYGIHKASTHYRKALGIQDFSFYGVPDASKAVKHHCNFVNLTDVDVGMDPGTSTPAAGSWSVKALNRAMDDLQSGLIDVLVTAPINKQNVQSPEFQFPGHTEYLAARCNSTDYLMLLVNEGLRVGTVTGHIPIQQVASKLNVDLIVSRLKVMAHSLLQDFGIRAPRIAVLGLNPHAGDNGLIGKEEEQIILPAIKKANQEGILAFGPYPADGFFGTGAWKKFDGVMAMFHDQGLIPFKSIAFHHGVNFTAGLPVIRTSPDHGTGYDIVGKNEADPSSFREAVFQAIDIYRNRKQYLEMSANPLQAQVRKERERERNH